MLLTPKFNRHQVGAIPSLHYANLIDIRGIIPLTSSIVRVSTVISDCRDDHTVAIDVHGVTDNRRAPGQVSNLKPFRLGATRSQDRTGRTWRGECYLVKIDVLLAVTADQCPTVHPRSKRGESISKTSIIVSSIAGLNSAVRLKRQRARRIAQHIISAPR